MYVTDKREGQFYSLFFPIDFKKLAFKNTNKFSFENRNINGLKLIIV